MSELPTRRVERLTAPFVRFMHLQAASGGVLLLATVVALVVANSALAGDYAALWDRRLTVGVADAQLSYPLWYWVNDGLMAIFFFVIGLEIKRELTWGELRDRRNVVLPVVGAVGGALVPIAIFLVLQPSLPGRAGWAVPMATDIAFVVGCLAVLGARVPPALKVFMLSLAIIDDMLAVVVIAVAFSGTLSALWGAGALAGIAAIVVLSRLGVRRVGVYVAVGAWVWLCTLESGIHPTIAGVVLGLLTPARAWIPEPTLLQVMDGAALELKDGLARTPEHYHALEQLSFAATESVSPLERLEHGLHPWVAFVIMPVFALANAAVEVGTSAIGDPLSIAVMAGLVLGKPLGISLAVGLAVKVGLARLPENTSVAALIGGAALCGIGFTMALFIASLSLAGPALGAAKAGILIGSAISLVVGMSLLAVALRGRVQAS